MKTRSIPTLLFAAIFIIAAAQNAHAQATPISIDFESPTYTDGMAPGSFPSIWTVVDTGVTVTTTGALSGSQSLSLTDNTSSQVAGLFIDAPDNATTLNISFLIKPIYIDTNALFFGSGGGFVLRNETNADPSDGGDQHAFGLDFEIDNQLTNNIRNAFNGSVSNTNIGWTPDTAYTVNIGLDFAAATVNYTVLDGVTTIVSNSGAFGTRAGNEFVLNFYGETLDAGTLVDSISVVSAVPEPSTYAAIAGLAVLGLAAWRRRKISG